MKRGDRVIVTGGTYVGQQGTLGSDSSDSDLALYQGCYLVFFDFLGGRGKAPGRYIAPEHVHPLGQQEMQ